MAAYERAIALLQTLRPALLRAAGRGGLAFQSMLVPERRGGRTGRRPGPPAPLTFREAFGPLYFALADLLLRRAATLDRPGPGPAPAQYTATLQQVRLLIEQFKTAELRDYFGDECVAAPPRLTALEHVAPDAAIVYPILLADRTELLVSFPGSLKRVALPIPGPTLEQQVRSFRAAVERQERTQYLPLARDLYTWLIHPLEGELTAGQIGTIVWVPDGALRALPLAALHDGQQFLIQKYALAVTPSLALTDPHPLPRDRVHILAAGVTQEVAGFPALPFVQAELDSLRQRYGGVVLLNQAFSPEHLEQALQQGDFGIVHIASHGQFAATAARSFLLTGQGPLPLERFAQLVGRLRLRARPLELLTLSACDTAQGDDRAALGFAGVAIQAGARSALASLWAIADDATAEVMRVFYTHLHTPGVSKAQALQRAQLALLQQPRYAEPVFWAPFLVLNNWL
jgi:CHAT domain-containing protein